jgi:hypothetical protein
LNQKSLVNQSKKVEIEMKIPTFAEVQLEQKPVGAYSIYCSSSGVSLEGWEEEQRDGWKFGSVTITLANWETYNKKTRIHRTQSILKVRLFPHKPADIVKMNRLAWLANLMSANPGLNTSSIGNLSEGSHWTALEKIIQESKKSVPGNGETDK